MRKVKKMIIMTGPSGYGKSTLAKYIRDQNETFGHCCSIFSTDDLFIVDGQYKFDPSKLKDYHQRNRDRVYEACKSEVNVVIVDNTNLTLWEIKPYILIALIFGYEIDFLRPKKVEGTTNIHGVPDEKIKQMEERMIPVEEMISFKNNIENACK